MFSLMCDVGNNPRTASIAVWKCWIHPRDHASLVTTFSTEHAAFTLSSFKLTNVGKLRVGRREFECRTQRRRKHLGFKTGHRSEQCVLHVIHTAFPEGTVAAQTQTLLERTQRGLWKAWVVTHLLLITPMTSPIFLNTNCDYPLRARTGLHDLMQAARVPQAQLDLRVWGSSCFSKCQQVK